MKNKFNELGYSCAIEESYGTMKGTVKATERLEKLIGDKDLLKIFKENLLYPTFTFGFTGKRKMNMFVLLAGAFLALLGVEYIICICFSFDLVFFKEHSFASWLFVSYPILSIVFGLWSECRYVRNYEYFRLLTVYYTLLKKKEKLVSENCEKILIEDSSLDSNTVLRLVEVHGFFRGGKVFGQKEIPFLNEPKGGEFI